MTNVPGSELNQEEEAEPRVPGSGAPDAGQLDDIQESIEELVESGDGENAEDSEDKQEFYLHKLETVEESWNESYVADNGVELEQVEQSCFRDEEEEQEVADEVEEHD